MIEKLLYDKSRSCSAIPSPPPTSPLKCSLIGENAISSTGIELPGKASSSSSSFCKNCSASTSDSLEDMIVLGARRALALEDRKLLISKK